MKSTTRVLCKKCIYLRKDKDGLFYCKQGYTLKTTVYGTFFNKNCHYETEK